VIRELTVVVPAANEEKLIAACLRSIELACKAVRRGTGGRVRADVLVVLDCCHDRSAEIVARFADVSAILVDERCVGGVRAVGAEVAIRRAARLDELWLANTDADSVVPPDWLTHMLAQAERGADVVLGTVLPGDELSQHARQAWLDKHDLTDGHRHVHGANLGIRASSLAALGGWAPLVTGEDVELVSRATAAGYALARTGSIPVRSSARVHGRAPQGFSSYLRGLLRGNTADEADSLIA